MAVRKSMPERLSRFSQQMLQHLYHDHLSGMAKPKHRKAGESVLRPKKQLSPVAMSMVRLVK